MTDLTAARERHHAEPRRPEAELDARGDLIHDIDMTLICRRCRTKWPCDASVFHDALDDAMEVVKASVALRDFMRSDDPDWTPGLDAIGDFYAAIDRWEGHEK